MHMDILKYQIKFPIEYKVLKFHVVAFLLFYINSKNYRRI